MEQQSKGRRFFGCFLKIVLAIVLMYVAMMTFCTYRKYKSLSSDPIKFFSSKNGCACGC